MTVVVETGGQPSCMDPRSMKNAPQTVYPVGLRSFWEKCRGFIPFVWNHTEPGGEVPVESCCKHAECRGSVSSRTCRHFYRLVFMTPEPLRDSGSLVRSRLRMFYPGHQSKDSVVLNYTDRTKWGFYVRQVFFKIPDGVELTAEDSVRLRMLCAVEGQPNPILFSHSCCREKTRLVDDCVNLNWSGRDEDGPELELSRSVEDVLGELAESVWSALGTTCT